MVTLHTQRNRGQRVSIRYILFVSTGTSTSAVSQLCKSFRCQNLPHICFFQQQLGILDHVLGVPQVILAKVFSRSAGPSSQKYESFMYDIYFGGLLLPQKQWNVNVDEGPLLGCGTRARCGHLHRKLFLGDLKSQRSQNCRMNTHFSKKTHCWEVWRYDVLKNKCLSSQLLYRELAAWYGGVEAAGLRPRKPESRGESNP